MIWFLAVNVREPIARSNFSSESGSGCGCGGGGEGIPRRSCWWCVALFSKDKREWANSLLPNTDHVSGQNLPFPKSVFACGFWKLYSVWETITLFKLSQCYLILSHYLVVFDTALLWFPWKPYPILDLIEENLYPFLAKIANKPLPFRRHLPVQLL